MTCDKFTIKASAPCAHSGKRNSLKQRITNADPGVIATGLPGGSGHWWGAVTGTTMHDTAHEIMNDIVIVLPCGYAKPADSKDADRDHATFIFEQQPELMQSRGITSPEELWRKYWDDPHGRLPMHV